MISEIIPVFSRKPIFGYGFVASANVAIAFLSYGVWAHHMFAVGLGHVVISIFGARAMLIAIPIGVQGIQLDRHHVGRFHSLHHLHAVRRRHS